jgi:putative oxidoreductase
MTHTHAATAAPAGPFGARKDRGKAVNVLLWVMQAFVALGFAFAGVLKLGGSPVMVDLFTHIGVGQWFRYVIGTLEVAGAVGVLIPLVSGVAALGLTCLMVGATVTNLFVIDESAAVPLANLLLAALIAWGRWPRTRALIDRFAG